MSEKKQVSAAADFVAGNMSGMAQVIVGQPIDTIKVRLQLDHTRFNGAWDCAAQTIRKEGFFALYKGMASPLVGIGAVNAVLFAANSSLKKAMQAYPGQTLTIGQIALAGAGAGIVNSALASPVELLKIKLQAQYSTEGATQQFKGPIDCARQLIRNDGFTALFRGMYVTILREIPAYAGFYSGYEIMKRYLTQGQEGDATILQLMASGSVGGMSYWLASYPLDVVKSVVQNQNGPLPRGLYVTRVMKEIVAREGTRGLFRGLAPAVVRSIPAAGATFTTYELCMRTFSSWS
ncbi:mitochondrial carrier domain-containing protein [Zychaea mexicana]|uniref:mitochondrial carrier domain-containing protein n=1 Tax=Zychaea mexicana TaxID=64656 RepID=UPI0022FE839E|nr:mitochondrial carrier domain-containing protein [Zychaea mexicana]KAI9484559.1 mitochondrial carrier domain-containing protein [Zychaea mexicana]